MCGGNHQSFRVAHVSSECLFVLKRFFVLFVSGKYDFIISCLLFQNDTRPSAKKTSRDTTGRVQAPLKRLDAGPGNKPNTSFFFTQLVMSGRKRDLSREEDPREALLKMDQAAKSDPIFLGRAYSESQPVTSLHTSTFEQEQEEFKKKQKRLP